MVLINGKYSVGLLVALLTLSSCSKDTTSNAEVKSESRQNIDATAKVVDAAKTAMTLPAVTDTPQAYIISPASGATVTSPVRVIFGLSGMGVAPAGVDTENTGHHHLLIDLDELPDMSLPLPSTDNIVHFGGGQTETSVTLTPGKHTLQLLLGDFAHRPHATPILSEPTIITVTSE